MREIKFRVWCVDNNEWEKDSCMLTLDGLIIHPRGIALRKENHILTQFTGLRDEKKRDIYEKDIVKCSGHDDLMIVHYCDEMSMYVLLPVWEDYNYYTSDPDNDFEDKMLWDNNRIEVMGNIFENSEYNREGWHIELCDKCVQITNHDKDNVCLKCKGKVNER